MYIPSISTSLDIHGISMDIRVYPMNIGQDSIYMGYTWYIPCIYWKSGFQMTGVTVSNRDPLGESLTGAAAGPAPACAAAAGSYLARARPRAGRRSSWHTSGCNGPARGSTAGLVLAAWLPRWPWPLLQVRRSLQAAAAIMMSDESESNLNGPQAACSCQWPGGGGNKGSNGCLLGAKLPVRPRPNLL
jgi:hypothetical protein